MHHRISASLVLAAIAVAACSTDVVAPAKAPMAPSLSVSATSSAGRYIVSLKGAQTVEGFTSKVEVLGGTVASFHAGARIAVVSGLTEEAALQLSATGVGETLADFTFSPNEILATAQADASGVASDAIDSQMNPAGAGRFNWQWNMRLINADAAWTAHKLGSPAVTVAIIDTGIDYDAPDLNGLVDLSRSTSFMSHFVGVQDDPTTPEDEYTPIVPSDNQIVGFFPGRNLITDLNGHGTNVATQVSSKAVALAGVTSQTTLIGVKVLGANGYGSFSDILNGVLWAADHGADVANMSLGGGFSKAGNGRSVGLINQVFNYANSKGMVVVVAAGNSGIDLQHIGNGFSTYCDAPNVICVSSVGPAVATGDPNTPAFYTNYGKNNVDVAGPGGNADAAHNFAPSRWPWSAPAPAPFTGNDIASWVWSYCAKQTLIIQKAADGVHGDLFLTNCINGNRLTGDIGTSQASPHVAGLAALLIAEKGKMAPQRIKQIVQQSGFATDKALGRGRIDVKAALGL
jgi:subtilisin family serine protease